MPIKKTKRRKQIVRRPSPKVENMKIRVMQFRVVLAINLLLILAYFVTKEGWVLFPLVLTLPILFANYLRAQPAMRKKKKRKVS